MCGLCVLQALDVITLPEYADNGPLYFLTALGMYDDVILANDPTAKSYDENVDGAACGVDVVQGLLLLLRLLLLLLLCCCCCCCGAAAAAVVVARPLPRGRRSRVGFCPLPLLAVDKLLFASFLSLRLTLRCRSLSSLPLAQAISTPTARSATRRRACTSRSRRAIPTA
jgi:hypothetical protein